MVYSSQERLRIFNSFHIALTIEIGIQIISMFHNVFVTLYFAK
jgi:hypothetical protein